MSRIEIKNLGIELLKEYDKNPRHNDKAVEFVANSIKDYGFKVPVVVDKNNVVVAGHTRLKAAKELGLETVPCIIADDLNDEQIKAFRIADNKVSELAAWDVELLKEELFDLKNLGVGLEKLGFMDFELDSVFGYDVDIDGFFEDRGDISTGNKKEITCPECGHKFQL